MVGDQLLASIGLLNSHWHENRGVIRAHALQARVMAEPDLHAPLGVYDWNAAWITGEIATRNPDPAQPLAVQPIRIPATKPEDIHLALPDDPANPLQVTDHPIITPHDDLVETTGRHLILGAGMPTMLIVDMDRSDAAGLDLVRRAATRTSTFDGSVNECIRQAQATGPGYDPAPDEGPTGLWPAANMFPDPAALPGAISTGSGAASSLRVFQRWLPGQRATLCASPSGRRQVRACAGRRGERLASNRGRPSRSICWAAAPGRATSAPKPLRIALRSSATRTIAAMAGLA